MSETISATEFKAKCLELLDQVARGELPRLIVTKRGNPVAMLVPLPAATAAIEQLYGWQRGSVIIPPGFDLTEPVLDEPFDAEEGIFHR
ncbi:MAG TPA: type II toxin-antitoxin system prevent-host-death family antitoxin [Stellaceae bacterium]|jgi:prevent-host-death family protein|nr:type II toxin-antitoxin system prevent-host-death family antitoxin [Stellaceae bacterium]